MSKYLLILDSGHAKNTAGKKAFDNSFYEFNVSHFYKLNKGDVQTIIYTILDKDGNSVNDFSSILADSNFHYVSS